MAESDSKRGTRRGFGALRKLPSGRYQASYCGPDGKRVAAPSTYGTKKAAEAWLSAERLLIEREDWSAPKERRAAAAAGITLRQYAPGALDRRRTRGQPLRPRTRALYDGLLERLILPTLGDRPMKGITRDDVADWRDGLDAAHGTQNAHSYALLASLYAQAISEGKLPAGTTSPCTIRGAGVTRRKREVKPASVEELAALTEATDVRIRPAILLAGWAGLRFGEVFELRRGDLDLTAGVVRVRRAVVRVNRQNVVGSPKSDAGARDVALPPHLYPLLAEHLNKYVGRRADALLFPSCEGGDRPMTSGNFYKKYYEPARNAAGLSHLRFHDLRHTAAVMAAQTGASLAELMGRLGHSTVVAALRYQHAAQGRDAEIAAKLSALAASQSKPE